MPVRHGKSELISHWMIVWLLSVFPDWPIILTSYADDLAEVWSGKCIATIAEHGQTLGLTLRPTMQTKREFQTTRGGGLRAVGITSGAAGRGAKFLVGDDLLKNWEEANSPATREKVWQEWNGTFMTRLEPRASAVLVMSRWHEDDPIGRTIRQAKETGRRIEIIDLPALAESPDDALGRAEGEALWPERWPAHVLKAIRTERGPTVWNGQYRQRPQPLEGGILKAGYLRFYRIDRDAGCYVLDDSGVERRVAFSSGIRFGTMDLAISLKTTADYTVTAAFLWVRPRLLLLDVHRQRLEFSNQIEQARAVGLMHRLDWIGVEATAYQAAFVQEGKRRIQGIKIRPIEARGDKVTRAMPLEAMMAAGDFFVPEAAPWLADLIDELVHFPTGTHDDQVDALAYAARATTLLSEHRVRLLQAVR